MTTIHEIRKQADAERDQEILAMYEGVMRDGEELLSELGGEAAWSRREEISEFIKAQ